MSRNQKTLVDRKPEDSSLILRSDCEHYQRQGPMGKSLDEICSNTVAEDVQHSVKGPSTTQEK